MANVINFNPDYPDLFLGMVEKAGSFKDEKTEKEIAFHNFFLSIALRDVEVDSNTVSFCGVENLAFTKDSAGKFVDKRKVKAEDISRIFGTEITTAEQLKDKIFQNCEVLFDKKGNIKRISFEEPVSNSLLKVSAKK